MIRQYWEELGLHYPGYSTAWSAVFISWLMKTAGAGDYFLYSAGHINYIRAAYRNRGNLNRNRDNLIRENPFWLYCPNEVVIEPGDLVCKNRTDATTGAASHYTCNNLVGGPGLTHCDLVVDVISDFGYVEVIGGNKDNPDTPSGEGTTVAKQRLRIDADGHIATDGDQNEIFAVIKLRTEYDDRPRTIWA
jgi:hypothetical protein